MNKTLKIFSLILVLLLRAVVSYSSALNLADHSKVEKLRSASQDVHYIPAESVEPFQESNTEDNDEREGGSDDDSDIVFALLQSLVASNAAEYAGGERFHAGHGSDHLFVLFRNFRL